MLYFLYRVCMHSGPPACYKLYSTLLAFFSCLMLWCVFRMSYVRIEQQYPDLDMILQRIYRT